MSYESRGYIEVTNDLDITKNNVNVAHFLTIHTYKIQYLQRESTRLSSRKNIIFSQTI